MKKIKNKHNKKINNFKSNPNKTKRVTYHRKSSKRP